MSETIDLKVTVDAKQAQSAIAGLKGEILGMRDAIAQGRGIDHLGEQAKALQTKMGPAAAAISGVSAALGQQAGEAGKAVAAAGQLVAAFGSGGPLGVAIAAATIGVNALTQAWEDDLKAQEAALAKRFAVADKLTQGIRDLRAEQEKIRVAQLSPMARIEEENAKSIASARDKVLAIEKDIATQKSTINLPQLNDELRLAKSLLNESEQTAKAKADQQLIADSRAFADEAVRLRKEANDRYAQAIDTQIKAKRAEQEAFAALETNTDEISRTMRGLSPVAGGGLGEVMRTDVRQAQDASAAVDADIALGKQLADVNAAILDDKERKAQEHYARLKAMDEEYVSAVTSGLSSLVGVTASYFADKAAGAADSEARAASAALKGIGDALIGVGTKQAIEGAGIAILSAGTDPRGAALIALGAGAIATGIGFGAGAAAVAPKTTTAGATGAARDPGASPHSARQMGQGGGPLVVNVSYGVTGPLPEDTAREIQKATRTAGRR